MSDVNNGTMDILPKVVKMMTLRIEVNGEEIGAIHARNIETEEFVKQNPTRKCQYSVYQSGKINFDSDKTVFHNRKDGILKLAKKILKVTEELL